MLGWPWMKNAEVGIADPVGDLNGKKDPRPPVKALVDEYRPLIDRVRNDLSLHELYDETKHDDLWILRFLLSHKGDPERALEAAQTTLVYRDKLHLDEQDIRAFAPQDRDKVPNNKAFHRFMDSGIGQDSLTLVVPDAKKGGVVFYFHIASLDTHKLAELDQDDWFAAMSYVNEWQFQWLDYITRTTGRLTKAFHIVEAAGLSFGMYNYTTQAKYTTAAREMQDCYPQAVKAYLVVHAPVWIEGPWKFLKPLLPTRVVEKLDFLNPQAYPEDKERLLECVREEHLPERFGGTYEPWPPKFPLPL